MINTFIQFPVVWKVSGKIMKLIEKGFLLIFPKNYLALLDA